MSKHLPAAAGLAATEATCYDVPVAEPVELPMSEQAFVQKTAELTPDVVAALHADDIAAARNIVLLTLGIFIIGFAMYTVVALICAS